MKKKAVRRLIWFCVILVLITIGSFWYAGRKVDEKNAVIATRDSLIAATGVNPLKPTAIRADFMVYVEGKEVVFTDDSLMDRSPLVSLQKGDENVNVINVLADGITIREFFRTISIDTTHSCITIFDQQYCSDPTKGKTVKYYVNGQPNTDAPDYVIQDGDRILVSYGSESYQGIQKQLDTVGTRATPAPADAAPDASAIPATN